MATFEQIQTSARSEIDIFAERARRRYMTPGAGQASVYLEKADQATDYKVAGYPVDMSGYPFIQAEVNATGKTKEQATDDILAQRSAWITLGATIEQERLLGKKNVTDAVTEEDVTTEKDAAIATLKVI